MNRETQHGRFMEWQIRSFLEPLPRTGSGADTRRLQTNLYALPSRQKLRCDGLQPEREPPRITDIAREVGIGERQLARILEGRTGQ